MGQNVHHFPPGTQTGRYRIDASIGAGGMGVVYSATDQVLLRTVALKFLPPGLAVGTARERFLREAITSSALDHPHIGSVFSLEEWEEQPFIVMAYYSGGSLSDRVRRGPIPVVLALQVACELASGLAAAHSKGIVHRDIKPSNILFTDTGISKIVDFGLARMTASPELTAPGTTMGTASYMAPEQTASADVGPQADVWALGVVLYEMLSGRRPFTGHSYPAILRAVLYEDPPRLENVPPELVRVVEHALLKSPADRYPSAGEMLADLERIRGNSRVDPDATATLVVGPAPEPAPAVVRNRMRPRLALSVAILVALAAAVFAWLEYAAFGPLRKQVAILPLSGGSDPLLQQLADGVSALMTDSLVAVNLDSGPRLASAAEVQTARVTNPALARGKLGSDGVITGVLSRDGGNIRAAISLVDTKAGKVTSSITVSAPSDNIVLLEHKLTAEVARLLGIPDAPAGTSVERMQAKSPVAFEHYLRALGFLKRSYDSRSIDAAIGALQAALETAPASMPVQVGLCEAYVLKFEKTQDGKWLDLAEIPCLRAPEADPRFARARERRGAYRAARGDPKGAMEDFERALVLDPGSETASVLLASTKETVGLLDQAEAGLKSFVASHPASWSGHRLLAFFYFRHDRFDEAAREFRQVIRLTPDSAAAYSNLGMTLSSSEHLPEAEQAYQKSLQLGSTFATYSNVGNLYLRQERYAEAAVAYQKALEFDPSQHRVWGNLAVAYSRTPGQQSQTNDAYRRAAELCKVILKANPNDAHTLSNLASYEAFTGERADPLEKIQQALALAPKDSAVLYNAAETYEYLGFREQALLWLGKLLDLGYPVRDIERSRALEGLRKDSRYKALISGRK